MQRKGKKNRLDAERGLAADGRCVGYERGAVAAVQGAHGKGVEDRSRRASDVRVDDVRTQGDEDRRVFRRRYGEIVLRPEVSVEVVASGLIGENKSYTKRGLIDTGSNKSAISKRIADELGLEYHKRKGMTMNNLNSVEYFGDTWVWLQLVNDETGERVRTWHMPISVMGYDEAISWHPQVLIGMDVIAFGRLTVDSLGDETVLTFEMK